MCNLRVIWNWNKKANRWMFKWLAFTDVPRTRLELACPNGHHPLKVACLPISPSGLRHLILQRYYFFLIWHITSTIFFLLFLNGVVRGKIVVLDNIYAVKYGILRWVGGKMVRKRSVETINDCLWFKESFFKSLILRYISF